MPFCGRNSNGAWLPFPLESQRRRVSSPLWRLMSLLRLRSPTSRLLLLAVSNREKAPTAAQIARLAVVEAALKTEVSSIAVL